MPPRKKAPAAKAVRPTRVREVCPDPSHEDVALPAGVTHFACEHGSWDLSGLDEAEPVEQSDDEFLDELQGADE